MSDAVRPNAGSRVRDGASAAAAGAAGGDAGAAQPVAPTLQEQLQKLHEAFEKQRQEALEKDQAFKKLKEAFEKQDEDLQALKKQLQERDEAREQALRKEQLAQDEERKAVQRVRTLQQVFSTLSEMRMPPGRASPTASQPPGSFSESASGAARGDDASESRSTAAADSVGAADNSQGGAAAAVGAHSNQGRAKGTNSRLAASVTTATGTTPEEQAEVKKAPRNRSDDPVRRKVRGEAFKLRFRYNSAGPGLPDVGIEFPGAVDTLAHMIKEEFLRKLPAIEGNELPLILVGTAKLLGMYPGRGDVNPINVEKESMKRDGGLPLLPLSVRNVVVMPKGLEVSMDEGKWVLEPLLPGDTLPEGQERWRPTMWRFRVLVETNGVDDHFDMTRLAFKGNEPIPVKVYGVPGLCVGPVRVPLSKLDKMVFTFDWTDVAIRSLVFVYLYTLSGRRRPATNLRDSEVLAEGIDRVRTWLQAAKALEKKLEEGLECAAARQAPSMELVRAWLDSLDDCPPLGTAGGGDADGDGAARNVG
jgi:hypothetical protein